MNLQDLPITYRDMVRDEHIDLMGHMNVMYYTHFIERATLPLYELFNFGLEYHTHSGFGSFVIEEHTRYLNEVRLGDAITVFSRLIGRGRKTLHYINFMRRDRDGALAATMEKMGIHIDLASRKSAPLPDAMTTAYDALLAEHQSLGWDAPLSGSMGTKR
jgi:acyl-CoA thioester hydrolase